jgi:hypothetical protein
METRQFIAALKFNLTMANDNLYLRAASLEDAPEIARLHVDAWEGAGERPRYESRLELWHHVLGGGARRSQVWVALDDMGEIVGFASAGRARVVSRKYVRLGDGVGTREQLGGSLLRSSRWGAASRKASGRNRIRMATLAAVPAACASHRIAA